MQSFVPLIMDQLSMASARKSNLNELEPVANAALRLSLGAFRTSPIPSLQAYLEKPPLSIRRNQLAKVK